MNPKSVSEVNLFDLETQQCPYHAYKTLRDEAPVYRCPATGMYVITRFQDVRHILTDTEHFTNETAYLTDATEPSPRALKVRDTFEQEGWVPAKTLNGRDDPDHKAVRAVFNDAFRPKKIEALEDEVRDLAY
ncbi:MAG: cytochrome P450, partial [Halieaceae bacterium]